MPKWMRDLPRQGAVALAVLAVWWLIWAQWQLFEAVALHDLECCQSQTTTSQPIDADLHRILDNILNRLERLERLERDRELEEPRAEASILL